jgi:pilus assembly protein Flp/PilA
MSKTNKLFAKLMQDESGQDLIEYALVAGLIGLGAVVAMTSLSTTVSSAFSAIGTKLSTAV